MKAVLLVVLALLAPEPAAVERPGTDVDATPGLAYARAKGYSGQTETLRMDVYRPAGGGGARRPAILWIHGGGFITGNRDGMATYARAFASRGYVSGTMDYRLASDAQRRRLGYRRLATSATADATEALAYLRRRAGRLGIDPQRIYVGGYSAGAITALQLARDGAKVKGAVAIAGAVAPSFGGPSTPVLWFHGRDDRTVPYAAARVGCTANCELVSFSRSGHEIAATKFDGIVARTARWLAQR